jgi:hypothetical protein
VSLVGFRYCEASDPGAVGAGYQWYNTTTGIVYERDTGNNNWIAVGNSNLTNYGHLPTTGGAMSGAITGVTGWAPVSAPNFTSEAKLNGINLATVNDLASLQTSLESMISSLVSSEIASSSSTVSISNNLIVTWGTMAPATNFGDTTTLPAPIFGDGIQATAAQCYAIVSPTVIGDSTEIHKITCINVGSNPLTWICSSESAGGSGYAPQGINYLILAVR